MRNEAKLFESVLSVQMELGVERRLIISMHGVRAPGESLSILTKDSGYIPFSDRWKIPLTGKSLRSFNKFKAWENVPISMDQLMGDTEALATMQTHIEYDKQYEVSFLAVYSEHRVTYIYPSSLRITTIY